MAEFAAQFIVRLTVLSMTWRMGPLMAPSLTLRMGPLMAPSMARLMTLLSA